MVKAGKKTQMQKNWGSFAGAKRGVSVGAGTSPVRLRSGGCAGILSFKKGRNETLRALWVIGYGKRGLDASKGFYERFGGVFFEALEIIKY